MSDFNEEDKSCGIVIDAMAIEDVLRHDHTSKKELGAITLGDKNKKANNALVFMVVGCRNRRWKYVVGYHLVGDSVDGKLMKDELVNLIMLLEAQGLRVQFITNDCSPCNKKMWTEFGISSAKNMAMQNPPVAHPVDPERVLEIIPDPVHIFKSAVRGFINNKTITLGTSWMERYGLKEGTAKIDHFTELVEWEDSQGIQPQHTLNREDVDFELYVSNIEKMKVPNSWKYACPEVTNAMRFMAEETGRPDLLTTCCFLERLAKWYLQMNSNVGSGHELDPVGNPTNYKHTLEELEEFAHDVQSLKVGEKGSYKPWQSAVGLATVAVIRLQNVLFKESSEVRILEYLTFLNLILIHLFYSLWQLLVLSKTASKTYFRRSELSSLDLIQCSFGTPFAR